MMLKWTILVVIAIGLIGCDDAEEDGLHVGTYNAGLTPGFVPLTNERAPRTLQALTREDLDLLCVQGLWRAEDMSAFETASAARWPSRVVPAPLPAAVTGVDAACDPVTLSPLALCATAACPGVPNDALASCVLSDCDTAFDALPAECATCLSANIGAGLDAIVGTCTTTPSGSLAFDGSFGLGLMSRYPILEQDLLVLDASFTRRGVIYARVLSPEVGEVHAFCTQLTPIFGEIPRPGGGTWEAEQRAQIEALLDFVASKTGGGGRVVVLGDFNTGPAIGTSIGAVAPSNYDLLLSALRNPFLENTARAECTYCASNPLVPDGAISTAIDHAFVRGLGSQGTARRFLTDDLQLLVDGEPVTTAHSDHYGVRVALIE